MKNDTAVFAAMRFDALAGKNVWTGLTGTRQAIRRDGYCIDPLSLNFCPHQWIDSQGSLIWNSSGTRPPRLACYRTALAPTGTEARETRRSRWRLAGQRSIDEFNRSEANGIGGKWR